MISANKTRPHLWLTSAKKEEMVLICRWLALIRRLPNTTFLDDWKQTFSIFYFPVGVIVSKPTYLVYLTCTVNTVLYSSSQLSEKKCLRVVNSLLLPKTVILSWPFMTYQDCLSYEAHRHMMSLCNVSACLYLYLLGSPFWPTTHTAWTSWSTYHLVDLA